MQPAPQRDFSSDQSRLLRDIGERAVAVVAIEDVLALIGDEQILEAVVVVVADANADAQPTSVRPALCGDVGESAVAIVFVEAIVVFGGAPVSSVPVKTKMSIQPSLS